MQRTTFKVTSALAFTFMAATLQAQKTTEVGKGGGGSPHVKTEWNIGGANISITYGRPSLKGRDEAKMMPAGKEWRTGADEATLLTTDKMLMFGSVHLPAGTYTINTVPGEKEWTIVLGTVGKPGQWGVPYMKNLELGRAPMTLSKAKTPAEMVTFFIDKSANGGVLRLEWGTVSVSTPFMAM